MFYRSNTQWARRAAWATVPFLAAVLSACGDDPVEPHHEPEFETIVFTVGSQTLTMQAANGSVTGGPITLQAGQTAALSAAFLLGDGQPDPVVTADEFRLDVQSENTAIVNFTRSGPFAGTLTASQAGTTQIQVSLFHIEEGHDEFGPFPISVVVN